MPHVLSLNAHPRFNPGRRAWAVRVMAYSMKGNDGNVVGASTRKISNYRDPEHDIQLNPLGKCLRDHVRGCSASVAEISFSFNRYLGNRGEFFTNDHLSPLTDMKLFFLFLFFLTT